MLFSLNNLAQLASDKPARHVGAVVVVVVAVTRPARRAARARASSTSARWRARTSAAAARRRASRPSAGIGSIDDLPVFGGGGFSEPAVIVPTARPSSNNKILYIMIGAVGLLAVVAVIMVVMLMKSKDKPQQVAAAAGGGDGQAGDRYRQRCRARQGRGSGDRHRQGCGSGSAGSATQVAEADTHETRPSQDRDQDRDQGAVAHGPATVAHGHDALDDDLALAYGGGRACRHGPEGRDQGSAGDSGGGCDEVSCVLNNYDGACCAKFKKKGGGGGGGGGARSGGGHSDLPDALDRSMISAGIANVKARVTSWRQVVGEGRGQRGGWAPARLVNVGARTPM